MKLNKTLLSIGTLAVVVTPIATVVSCGDKTPAKEQPPVTHTGGQPPITPTNQPPIAPAHQGPVNTGNPSQSDSLDEGIFDYTTDNHFSKEQLNNIFENKFSEDISFDGSAAYGFLGSLNKETIDPKRTRKKIMIAGTPNGNNGSYVILAGVIGYKLDLTGTPTNEVIFRFVDFNDVNAISDTPASTSEKNIILSGNVDNVDKNVVFALSLPSSSGSQVVDSLINYAKPFFTDATFS